MGELTLSGRTVRRGRAAPAEETETRLLAPPYGNPIERTERRREEGAGSRALAAFGLATVPVQMIAVAMPLLGYRFQVVMLMPAALSQLALILWLLAKGFNERPVRSIEALK